MNKTHSNKIDIIDLINEAERSCSSTLPIIENSANISTHQAEIMFAYCNKLNLGTNTRYLSYMIFNQILLSRCQVDTETALSISILLSSKIHEQNPICSQTVLEISPAIGSPSNILKYELYILSAIGFRTLIPTLHD